MSKQVPQKSRLGRGLSSLMSSASHGLDAAPGGGGSPDAASIPLPPLPPASVSVRDINIGDLIANPHQPRRHFDEAALNELADSLKTTGIIQPVVARATSDNRYELIAGERRWRAAKIAGLTTLPVIVRTVDPIMQAQMALVENLQRQDLNAIERAGAYQALLDNLGLTQIELADRLGEDRSVIGHYVRLLELAPAAQALIATGQLQLGHAKVLAGVADLNEQGRLAELAVKQELSVRNLEKVVSAGEALPARSAATPASAHVQDIEKTFSRQLGMRVQVRSGKKKGKGRLILHFGSLDQFDDLIGKLGLLVE